MPPCGDPASVAALSENAWVCQNILEMLSRLRRAAEPGFSPARTVAIHRAKCLAGRNAQAQERARRTASRPGRDPGRASYPGGRSALLAHLDGSGLPPTLRGVTSDRSSVLYVCSRDEQSRQRLFAKFLATGEVRELGRGQVGYWGAWFDTAEALLYAFFFRDAQFRHAGIDVFAADGRHLHRAPLEEGVYCNPPGLAMPQGNAGSLFFVDLSGQMILELDKRTFARRDVHHLYSGTIPSDYRCLDGRILMAMTPEHLLATQDLRSGAIEVFVGPDLLFPSLVEQDRRTGGWAVVTLERNPRDPAPLRHWLKTFDAGGALLSCADMGLHFARSMTLLDEARLAVFLDHNQGVFHHVL